MNFYIKKNSTLPVLTIEVVVDSRNSFGNTNEPFSASTVTFNMKDINTDFYYIIGHPVTIKEKYTTEDSPLKSYYLEVQFTERQTSKTGSFLSEFVIETEYYTEILPIENEIKVHIIDSFVESDFCCIDDPSPIFPTETPRPSVTPSPSPAAPIGCDDSLTAEGNVGYYSVEVDIGASTGLTSVILNSQTVPDRFLIYFDGNLVADSSFVGDGLVGSPSQYIPTILSTTSLIKYKWNGSSFINDGTIQVSFTNDDIADCTQTRSNANTSGNQIGVNTTYPNSGSNNCDGNVRLDFIKTTETTSMTVVGIGCNSGTVWTIDQIICPTVVPTPSVTPSITPTSVTPTVTPTISVTPSTTPVYFLNCDIVFNTPTGTTSIELTSTIELFNFVGRAGDNRTILTINESSLSDITKNKYGTLSLLLPDYEGNSKIVNLVKNNKLKDTINIVRYNNGIKTEEELDLIYTTYRVIGDDGSTIGGVAFKNGGVEGLYYINGVTTTLTSTGGINYVAFENESDSEFICGSQIPGIPEDVILQKTSLTSSNSYCVKTLWEVPFNLYNAIDTIASYNTQEFIEIQDFWLNTQYATASDYVNVSFEIASVVVYETLNDDPYKLSTYPSSYTVYSHMDDVQDYALQNYTDIEYDLLLNINNSPIPSWLGLNGIAGVNVMFTQEFPASYVFKYDIYSTFDIQNSNTYYDVKVVAHEVGHNCGLMHTFQGTNSLGGAISNEIPGCYGGSTCPSPQECRTIMSYCRQFQGLTLSFNDQRAQELGNFFNLNGQDLICNTVPSEPYFEISLDTNIVSLSFNYTVEFKNCFDGNWYTYGTNFNYDDFNLLVPISSIPFSADCYQYRITVEGLVAECQGYIYPYQTTSTTPPITPTSTQTPSITQSISVTPSITPTMTPTISITQSISVTPSITPTITPTISITQSINPTISVTPSITPSSNSGPQSGLNTIFVHYKNL